MLFEDKVGHILTSDDLLHLEIWEIEEMGIHMYNPER